MNIYIYIYIYICHLCCQSPQLLINATDPHYVTWCQTINLCRGQNSMLVFVLMLVLIFYSYNIDGTINADHCKDMFNLCLERQFSK